MPADVGYGFTMPAKALQYDGVVLFDLKNRFRGVNNGHDTVGQTGNHDDSQSSAQYGFNDGPSQKFFRKFVGHDDSLFKGWT